MPPNQDVIHESQLISEEPDGTNYPQSWPFGREQPLVWPSACCSLPQAQKGAGKAGGMIKWKWFGLAGWLFWV